MSGAGSGEALRQQLDERRLGWLVAAAINAWPCGGPVTISEYVARELWPIIEAALAAARVATATEIAEAIEASERPRSFVAWSGNAQAGVWRDAVVHFAALARGSVPAPKGDRK